MISTTLVALSAVVLSASARQIQSRSPNCMAFFNAGIQGCISAGENVDGEPVVIHDCNTEDLTLQDWTATFAVRGNTSPSPIKIFGDKCLDVTGGVNALGTKLQIWTCSGGPNQQWVNTLDGTFQWSGTDKCIDLSDGKITDGNQLQLYTCSSTNTNQKWGSAPNPDNGGPQIILGGNTTNQAEPIRGQPFCVGAASNADGAAVVLLGCGISNAGPNFPNGNYNWTAPFAPLTGTIKTFDNKCLDVPNGNNANGQKLQIWTCADGNTNQQFTIHANPNTIEWKGTGKCLDLTNGNSTIGNPIQLWDCNGANINQEWQLDTVQAF
ncbi:ricin B lectin domain-containing protein [Mycena albidolilacea]|uniref:Ricin B lectin domain-containing protein n=1 Tax=Mycena albidolilacea TaxID=1033008 RepID=A0AAD7EM54_9AGAR|nr:ricin B lectin domain-containing protein [Mycena albidolilacea]